MTKHQYIKQAKAKAKDAKKRILAVCPNCPESPGIYFFLREDNGLRYAYIGQAKSLLSRLAQHMVGHEHIDLSVKKHKFYNEDNPTGWRIHFLECEESALDQWEHHYIMAYGNNGYQLLNKTTGGQGKGKRGIGENKPSKGYYDGLEQGRRKAYRTVAELFSKHLNYVPKSDPPTRYQVKAMERFKAILEEEDNGKADTTLR